MKTDSTLDIFRSAKRFFSGTMLSRITGMLRDIAMASAFGIDASIAALMVAFRFAHLLRRLFGEGALQSAFIPQFEALRHDSPGRASKFYRDLTGTLSLGLFLIVIASMIVLGSLLKFGHFSPDNSEILLLTLIMMPSLLFICLFGLNAALLQCEKSYFMPSVAPVAFNLIWIGGVAYLWHSPPSSAMPYLAGFIALGCMFQWLLTVPQTWQHLSTKGFRIISSDVRRLSKPLFLGIIGVAASQINNALDVVFARYASEEGPAMLWYAIRIQQLPLALFGIALSGALLPPLSRAIKARNFEKSREFLQFAVKRGLAVMIPITLFLWVMGKPCISLIYGHGSFTSIASEKTTDCLMGYTFGLVPMTLVLILAPAFFVQGNYRTPTIATTLSMGCNIILNTIFIMGLGWGAASVAYATSISAWLQLGFLSYHLRSYEFVPV